MTKYLKWLAPASMLVFLIVPVFSAQLSRLHESTISNGSVVNASDLNGEFNQLLNESNSQDTRITAQESLNKGILSSDPLSPSNGQLWYNATVNQYRARVNGVTRRLLDTGTGSQLNVAQSSDPGSPVNGDFWYNDTSAEFKGRIAGATKTLATTAQIQSLATIGGAAPLYATSNTITLKTALSAFSDSGSVIITPASDLTVSLAVSGENGLDTGSEAANTWYYVWLIRKSSNGTVAGLLSASSTTPTLPSGYDQKRLLPLALRNDASSNIIPFDVYDWPNMPTIIYRVALVDQQLAAPAASQATTIYSNNAASGYQTVTCTYTPPISRTALLAFGTSSSSNQTYLRTDSSTANTQLAQNGNGGGVRIQIKTTASRTVDIQRSSGYIYVDNYGYVVDNF